MPHEYVELFDNSILTDIIHMKEIGSQVLQQLKSEVPFSYIYHQRAADSNVTKLSISVPGFHYEDSILTKELVMQPQHRHNTFEIMIVLSGTVIHHVENHTFHYSKGHCCLLNRNITHIEEYSSEYEVIFLNMKKEFIRQLLNQRTFFKEDRFIDNSLILQLVNENYEDDASMNKAYLDFIPTQKKVSVSSLRTLLKELENETIHPGPGSTYIIMGLITRLLSLLEDKTYFCTSRVECNSSQSEYLFMKIQLIIEAHHGCITRSELEKLLHYNGEYLNRIVQKFTGNNITYLCQTYMLNEFNLKLLNKDQTIESILDELNVTNRTHFYKLYRSRHGMTPDGYRKLNGL